jgi:ergothioneine biosynthesis protein EgtB
MDSAVDLGLPATSASSEAIAERYCAVRAATERLCAPLSPEDCGAQSMPDASPAKWHLAHTTWFFETFALEQAQEGFAPFHPDFRVLFNSYYNAVGDQHPRPERGLVTRPSLDLVFEYRAHVDRSVLALLEAEDSREFLGAIELGIEHECQHQELILTDVKHLLSRNPLHPAYRPEVARRMSVDKPLEWIGFDENLGSIGYTGEGFCFDNERPRHRVFINAFELATRPCTNAEYASFIEDGGYRRPELWLSDGWAMASSRGWEAPLYWRRASGVPSDSSDSGDFDESRASGDSSGWMTMTLAGVRERRGSEPVCHVSYYEADAFARWMCARLPTEAEWETAAAGLKVEGNFVETGLLHPAPISGARTSAERGAPSGLSQMFGDVWEWTQSDYAAYPGFRPLEAGFGEYNGKFMCNQRVLRGGSCATPRSHLRPTYRNFFPPDARWQFSGIRLARDVG